MTQTASLRARGAWTWFHNPSALYHEGRYRRTYYTYSDHGIWVCSFDHDSGMSEALQIQATSQDDHNVAAIGVRPDGRLIVAYSAHSATMFSRVSSGPESVSGWTDPYEVRRERATYPNLHYLATEDRWFLFYRAGPSGDWPTWFRTSVDHGETWGEETLLFANGSQRPYMQTVSDAVSKIDFSLTDGHPRNVVTNSIYHLQYASGAWRNSAGDNLGSPPFTPADVTQVYDGGAPGNARAWCWDIALDQDSCVMAFATVTPESDHRYHYARWDGKRWIVHAVVSAGRHIYETEKEPHYSAGVAIDHGEPARLYLARESAPNSWELEMWSTGDGGASWASSAITNDSLMAPYKNFRPVSVRGGGPFAAIWCAGDYRTYTDYEGGISALLRDETALSAGVHDLQDVPFRPRASRRAGLIRPSRPTGVIARALGAFRRDR